jgi:hypothetical protein
MLLWEELHGSVQVLGARKRTRSLSHARQRKSQISLGTASSHLKDRIDLGIQVLCFGERFCEGNSTEPANDLNLPSTLP